MPRARLDIASIVAGVGVAVLGVLVLLDSSGAIRLHFGVLGPVASATVGATLLAMGLTRHG
jgi:hypothetical protein